MKGGKNNFQKGQKGKVSNNFIEALRRVNHRSSEENSTFPLPPKEKKELFWQRAFSREKQIRRELEEIYNARERELKLQVEALKEEIRQINLSGEKVEKEIVIAAEEVPPQPSQYHFNFLLHLKSLILRIRKLRRRMEESAEWLAAWNRRAKKKGFFWRTFASKKGGAKFLLSSEHYLTRSAA